MSLQGTGKYMSLILRHRPEVTGIALDEYGGANDSEGDRKDDPLL